MTIPPPQNDPPIAPEGELPAWAKRRTPLDDLSDERLGLFIGPRWERSYRKKFAPFRDDASFVPTWNWSAALAMPFWFLYRKLYLAFAIFFMMPGFAFRWLTGSDTVLTVQSMQLPENESLVMMNMAVFLSAVIAAGGTANWLLFRRARAATRLVAMQRAPDDESTALLRRIGGVNRNGTVLFFVLSLMLAVAQLRA